MALLAHTAAALRRQLQHTSLGGRMRRRTEPWASIMDNFCFSSNLSCNVRLYIVPSAFDDVLDGVPPHAHPARPTHTITEQDARLADICATVGNLKRTSLAINEELREQASMVDSLASDVDRTHARVRRAEQRSAAMVGAKSETAAVDSSVDAPEKTWTEENCSIM